MLTRTSFCKKCYENKQPQHDTLFCIWGTNSNHFIIDYARVGERHIGFTPHNFEFLKYENGTVKFQKFCGICDVDIARKKMKWTFAITKLTVGTMPIKDWNAMQKTPDLGYHI